LLKRAKIKIIYFIQSPLKEDYKYYNNNIKTNSLQVRLAHCFFFIFVVSFSFRCHTKQIKYFNNTIIIFNLQQPKKQMNFIFRIITQNLLLKKIISQGKRMIILLSKKDFKLKSSISDSILKVI